MIIGSQYQMLCGSPYQAEGIGRTDDAMWGRHKGRYWRDKVYKPHALGKVPLRIGRNAINVAQRE